MYKCKICGYKGDSFVFQFTDYTYCVASNEEDPEFLNSAPKWSRDIDDGEAEIGEPIGCPKCYAWGVSNFEVVS